MRDWTKTLPNASFRGQPFFVEREQLAGSARKVAEHDYAKSEDHATEDMGRNTRRFRFTAYIVGDNADSDARAFVELCSTPGDGLLNLQIFGSYTVKCTGCDGSAEKERQGYVAFELEFIESGNDSAFSVVAIGDRIAASLQDGMVAAIVAAVSAFPS